MEGVTDQVFRSLVINLGGVGAACTEFIRLSVAPASHRVIHRYLGPVDATPTATPVGVQFMAAEETHVAASVQAAERAGAAFIDLNFGCPAPTVFGKCAGSALLDHPERMAQIIRAAVGATGLPVGAKLRAGITTPDQLEAVIETIAAANPAFITLHARLRIDPYSRPATWEWLRRAQAVLARCAPHIPLVGNGGIDVAADMIRMRDDSGCAAVMIGRGALADPFVFRVASGGAHATKAEAAAFALRYAEAVFAVGGARMAMGRLKQLTRYYRAGGLFAESAGEAERLRLMRCEDWSTIRGWYEAALTS